MNKKTQDSLSAFQSRDFSLFWFSALVSNSAQWMQQIAIPFIVFDLTESNSWVGTISFVLLIPAFLLTPVAGVLADRVSRVKVLIYTTSAQLLTATGFMILWQMGELTPVRILILSLFQGMSAGLQIPNWQSLVPQLVPKKHLTSAIRLNSMQFTAARAFGPLTGALVLSTLGAGAVFMINASTYLVLLGALAALKPSVNISKAFTSGIAALKEGMRYVTSRPAIFQAIITAFIISFFGQSLVQLAAGLASERYGVGETGLAGFVTASGIGTILGSGLLVVFGDHIRRSRMVQMGLALYAFGPVLVGFTTFYAIGLLGYFISGIAHMAVGISLNTAIQTQLEESVRGRVISVYLLGVFGGIPMGSIFGGQLGDSIGLENVFMIYGAGLVIYLGMIMLFYRGHKLLDLNSDSLENSGAENGGAGDAGAGGSEVNDAEMRDDKSD